MNEAYDDLCYEVRARDGNAKEALTIARGRGYTGTPQQFNVGPWRRGKRRWEGEHGMLPPRKSRNAAAEPPADARISYESPLGWFQMLPTADGFDLTFVCKVNRDVALSLQGQAFSLLFPDGGS